MSSPMSREIALVGLVTAALLWSGCGGSKPDSDARVRALADAMAQEEMTFLYHHNIQEFIKPQSRDVEVVRTGTARAAEEARAQIEAGVPFAKVAAHFSVDARGKRNGGMVTGVVRSQEDLPLGTAVFSAKLHILTGPVHLEPDNYYVFRIRAIRPPLHISLADYENAQFSRAESRLEHYQRQYYAQLKSQG